MVGFCHFQTLFFVVRVAVGATLFERLALFCGFRVSSFSIDFRITASEADHFLPPLVGICVHLAKVRFNCRSSTKFSTVNRNTFVLRCAAA